MIFKEDLDNRIYKLEKQVSELEFLLRNVGIIKSMAEANVYVYNGMHNTPYVFTPEEKQ